MGTYEAIERSIFKNQAFEALAGKDYFQIFSVFSISLVTLSTLYFQWRFSQCEQTGWIGLPLEISVSLN